MFSYVINVYKLVSAFFNRKKGGFWTKEKLKASKRNALQKTLGIQQEGLYKACNVEDIQTINKKQ